MITTDGYNYTKMKLTYQYVGIGMSIRTGETEASSRPGTSPGDDREDREDEHLEVVYLRERDMENSPRDSTIPSRVVTSPEGVPAIGADSSASPQAEPDLNTGGNPLQQQDKDGQTPMDKDGVDISERARRYIAKRKEEVKEHIKLRSCLLTR